MKVCEHPECEALIPRPRGRGRPALYCPEHRKTRYAMVRSRKYPELKAQRIAALPPCCREVSRQCPQHLAVMSQRTAYSPSVAERNTISELLDVWGHASIYNERGWNVQRLTAFDGEDSDVW